MRNGILLALVATTVLATGSCSRVDPKAEQIAALENAYQAGLLTKTEYDSKRMILLAAAGVAAPPFSSTVPTPPAQSAVPSPLPLPASSIAAAKASPVISRPAPVPAVPTPKIADPKKFVPRVASCADEDHSAGGPSSEARFFAASPEMVRRAALSSLGDLDFNLGKTSASEIEATKKRHIGAIVGAGGERVILAFKRVERNGATGTRVVVETKKSFVGRLAQKNWSSAVVAAMACQLASR